jgi:predicted GIY-YIG superfamily endonuclease
LGFFIKKSWNKGLKFVSLISMVGIYKITSPTGRIYIGQSTNIERRKVEYSGKNKCKKQAALYFSLVKYSFSEHIFEVVEEGIALRKKMGM